MHVVEMAGIEPASETPHLPSYSNNQLPTTSSGYNTLHQMWLLGGATPLRCSLMRFQDTFDTDFLRQATSDATFFGTRCWSQTNDIRLVGAAFYR